MNNYSSQLNTILDLAAPMLRSLEDVDMSQKPSPDKWSKKEILGHLIDSAYNNHQRFLRAEGQADLIFWGYAQDEWVKKNNYQNRTVAEIIETLLSVNRHLAQLLSSLPEELLTRKTSQHNFDKICMNRLQAEEETSLSYLIWDYLFHLEHHLSQILPSYNKLNPAFHS